MMSYLDTKKTIPREIRDTLADDIYDGWVLAAQDKSEDDSLSDTATTDLRRLADQAAFTAIGFAAAFLNEVVLKNQNE